MTKPDRMFDVVANAPATRCRDLVPLPRGLCPSCTEPLGGVSAVQVPLLRHGGYGEAQRSTFVSCPACGWAPAAEAAHAAAVQSEGPTTWDEWAGNYMRRAVLFGLSTAQGRQADAAFIAHARTDLPTALDEIDRLRANNHHLERALQGLLTAHPELWEWAP